MPTLREYLISLGWHLDEASYRRFKTGVATTAKDVAQLGSAAIATAGAITFMVERAAREFEDLYYVSQRTGVSVANLKAFEFASRQVGVSADEARSSTEAFYATMRTNPGMAGLARVMGFGGGPQQMVEVLKRQFGEGGYFVANRFAQMFGMDEKTFLNYWNNIDRLKSEQDDQRRRMANAGIDADDAAKRFTDFGRSVNRLESSFEILGTRLALDWLGPSKGFVQVLDELAQSFSKADSSTNGLIGRLSTLVALFTGNKILLKLLGIGVSEAIAGPALLLGGGAMVADANKSEIVEGVASVLRWLGIDQGTAQSIVSRFPGLFPGRAPGGGGSTATGGSNVADKLGRITGLNPDFLERLKRMRAAMPSDLGGFTVESGFRTTEEQARLYAEKPGLAAPPGRSNHEHGLAGDLKFGSPAAEDWVHAHAAEYGLAFPMMGGWPRGTGRKYEPWHIEPADINRSQFGASLAPSPMATAGATVNISHDTDINIYGPTTPEAQQGIFAAQSDLYAQSAQAVRNNLSRTR